LYKNGIQRESFVPCIELLKSRLDVTDLDSGTGRSQPILYLHTFIHKSTDYRRIPRALSHVYHSPLDHATRTEMRKLFDSFTAGRSVVQGRKLHAWGREIYVPESADDIALFEFEDLCGNRRPLSAADYIEVTKAFGTIFLTEVPKLNLGTKDLVSRDRSFHLCVLIGSSRRDGSLRLLMRAMKAR
jgi:protein AFG1